MKLRMLRLTNVRRFTNVTATLGPFGDGVTVIAADNEQGKSTFFDALQALFFVPHRSRSDAITSLQPYSGDAVEISAEIEIGSNRFLVEKRFLSKAHANVTDLASGRLIAQADLAETWIAALTKGGTGGPAGLLWVQQGAVGLEPDGKTERATHLAARQDLLSSVAGEVDVMTGGKRMDTVLARCQADLNELVTPGGKPKAGGPYAAVADQLAALGHLRENLVRDRDALRQELENRQDLRRQLVPVQDPAADIDRRQRLLAANDTLQRAREHASTLETALAEQKLARIEALAAQRALDEFVLQMGQLEKAGNRQRAAVTARNSAQSALALAQTADLDATKAADEAIAQTIRAGSILDRAIASQMAASAQKLIAGLAQRLATAEQQRDRMNAAKAAGTLAAISSQDLEQLTQAERTVADLRLRDQAGAAQVGVSYVSGSDVRFLRDGEPLDEGAGFALTRTTRIEMPGIGLLSLTPAKRPEAAAIERAEAALRAKLAALSVPDLAAAVKRHTETANLAEIARSAEHTLAAVAPLGVEALRIELEALKAQAVADPGEPTSVAAAQTLLENARETERQALAKREAARGALASADQALILAQAELRTADQLLSAADIALGEQPDRDIRSQNLRTTILQTEAALAEITTKVERLRDTAPDLEMAKAAVERAEDVVRRAAQERERITTELVRLDAVIGERAEQGLEERLAETEDKLLAVQDRVDRYSAEVAALRRLKSALDAARGAARERYFGPVREELRPLLAQLYDGGALSFDDRTLLPRGLTRDGLEEDVEVLSGGTREQIAVLTRLAFARLLARQGRPTPVILDDALVYSDDTRIEKMFTVLHRVAADLQVIVFTCRTRAFEGLGGDWPKIRIEPRT